ALARVSQVDYVERFASQLAQIGLAPRPEFLRAVGECPPLVGETRPSELRGDHEALRIRVQRLDDQAVRDVGTVIPRRVNQVHPERDDASEDIAGARRILWLTPDVRAGKAHRTEPEADDFEVPKADRRRAVSKREGLLDGHALPLVVM